MAVPKRRQSKSRSKKRNSHGSIKKIQLQNCSRCDNPIPSHVVCPNCGHYHGRTMVPSEG